VRCTQLLDGDGATEVVPRLLGFVAEEGECVVEDVEVLLGIRDVDLEDVREAVEDAEPSPCVVPLDEHPARANPATAQTLAARTNRREAATARR
jgi:hypothetical protein